MASRSPAPRPGAARIGTECLLITESDHSQQGLLCKQDIGLAIEGDISRHGCTGYIQWIGTGDDLITINGTLTARIRHQRMWIIALRVGVRRLVAIVHRFTICQTAVIRVAIQLAGSRFSLDCIGEALIVVITVKAIRLRGDRKLHRSREVSRNIAVVPLFG